MPLAESSDRESVECWFSSMHIQQNPARPTYTHGPNVGLFYILYFMNQPVCVTGLKWQNEGQRWKVFVQPTRKKQISNRWIGTWLRKTVRSLMIKQHFITSAHTYVCLWKARHWHGTWTKSHLKLFKSMKAPSNGWTSDFFILSPNQYWPNPFSFSLHLPRLKRMGKKQKLKRVYNFS